VLAAASESVRRRAGLRAWPALTDAQAELEARVRQALGTKRFDELSAAGAGLSQREAATAVKDTSRPGGSR